MTRRDPDDYLLVPADFEQPPKKGAAVMCPCGALEVCVCEGVSLHQSETFEGGAICHD